MSRCGVDAPAPPPYDVLKSVAGPSAPDTRYRFEWMSLPGRTLPPPRPSAADPYDLDDEHGGWKPVT